jgi:hypothetical protein
MGVLLHVAEPILSHIFQSIIKRRLLKAVDRILHAGYTVRGPQLLLKCYYGRVKLVRPLVNSSMQLINLPHTLLIFDM